MEQKYNDQFEKSVVGWIDEVDKQTKKRQKQAKKEYPDYYYM